MFNYTVDIRLKTNIIWEKYLKSSGAFLKKALSIKGRTARISLWSMQTSVSLGSTNHNLRHPLPTSLNKLGSLAGSVILQRSLSSHFQCLFPPLSPHSKKIAIAVEQFFFLLLRFSQYPGMQFEQSGFTFVEFHKVFFRLSCHEITPNFFLNFKECLPNAQFPFADDNSRSWLSDLQGTSS